MKTLNEILQLPRTLVGQADERGGMAKVLLRVSGKEKMASVSWSIDRDANGEVWEHVSVALPSRDPTWAEMCEVKRMFFHPEEECVQFHPKESEYVNLHPHCLHIWRNRNGNMKTPGGMKP